MWNEEGFFIPGEYTLESLQERARGFDGALIVATPDDRVVSRGDDRSAMRDNLLIEFGLFVALFGRRRALLAMQSDGGTKVPSDLYGLTFLRFEGTETASIAAAAEQAADIFIGLPDSPVDETVARDLDGILGVYLYDLATALGRAESVGVHVWLVDERATPPRLVRVARSRTTPKAHKDARFSEGEGIVGECWRIGSSLFVDFTERPYSDAESAAWEEFGPSVRRGMSFGQLAESRRRFRLIGAAPIVSRNTSGSRFLGCISYNVGHGVLEAKDPVNMPELEKILDRAVEVVRVILEHV